MGDIQFAALAAALLSQSGTLVPMWLPGGSVRGHEYVCSSLAGGAGRSMSVNLKNGRWADFSADESGGDLISLYAAIHGLDMGKAAAQVARENGFEQVAGLEFVPGRAGVPSTPRPTPAATAAPRRIDRETWTAIQPVPAHAPKPTFWHFHRQKEDIVQTSTYQLGEELFGYVVRFRTSDGGKDDLPYTWCMSDRDGGCAWKWHGFAEPRPLYLPGGSHPAGRTVVVVEGEIKATILQTLLDETAPGVYCVASWPGGCKAWSKATWQVLAGSTVLLWPDCDSKRLPVTRAEEKEIAAQVDKQFSEQGAAVTEDERRRARADAIDAAESAKPLRPAHEQPGMAAMLGIGALLRDSHGCSVQLLPIPAPGVVVDGWDAKDAIQSDGWDGAKVLAFFGRAGPLPQPTAVEAAPGSSAPGPAGANAGGGGGDKAHGAAAEPAGGREVPDWLRPFWDADRQRWLVSRKTVIAALQNDPALKDVLSLNQLANNIEARQPWPWRHGRAGALTGSVDLMLGQYLSTAYGMPAIARPALMEGVETVAYSRPFHPVREYLQAQVWDGVHRIDGWLVYALGEKPDTLDPAVYEYLCLVGRYWLLGMVNRVMQPGCKFDYCPVLEGPGGLGKSTMVELLASTPWFSDTHFDVARGKEGQEQVQGLWVYEIAELANFGKADLALIKAFITAKFDRYRPSYGRVVESYARQCVLVGTTNESTYLRDRTGNRRFWPIPVRKRINLDWLLARRDQLFAEAFHLYLEGVEYTPHYLDEERLFKPMQESRLVDSAVTSKLLEVLTRNPVGSSLVNHLTDFVTLSQLTEAMGVDAAKSNAGLAREISAWMESEGWKHGKKQVNGVRASGYHRPAKWPAEDEPDTNTGNTANGGVAGSSTSTQGKDDEPF